MRRTGRRSSSDGAPGYVSDLRRGSTGTTLNRLRLGDVILLEFAFWSFAMAFFRRTLIALVLAISLFGQSTLAIVEKKAGKVGFYTEEGRRLGEVQVGRYPHEMAFSPDRRLLYVTDNGMLWMTDPGEGGNSISIIDVRSRKKTGVIDLGNFRRPHGIAVLPRSGEIVVTIENPYGLLRIDPVARKVVRKYDVAGKSPHMVLLGDRTAWVSNRRRTNVPRGGRDPDRHGARAGFRRPRPTLAARIRRARCSEGSSTSHPRRIPWQ